MRLIFFKDERMVNFFLFLGAVLLQGCTVSGERVSLDVYHESKKYVQEHIISSNKNLDNSLPNFDWRAEAFKNRCEWFALERVVDGDTIIVLDPEKNQVRVRMIGIDTPESKRAGTSIEPFALESTEALKQLLNEPAWLCLIEDRVGDKIDTYGRKLSYVFTAEGQDINADMILSGWAEAYTRFPMERKAEFEALELEARNAKVGRWE